MSLAAAADVLAMILVLLLFLLFFFVSRLFRFVFFQIRFLVFFSFFPFLAVDSSVCSCQAAFVPFLGRKSVGVGCFPVFFHGKSGRAR